MIPQKRIRVLVNPSARSGRVLRAVASLAESPTPGLNLEWVESRSAGHFGDVVRQSQEEELDALALAGGDGTVALALAALDGPNRVPLAVLPGGSGNDFAHQLGMPRRLPDALASLAHAEVCQVDVARASPGGRYCCAASAGLDELALRVIHRSGWPRSKALNVTAALWALAAYRPRPVRVAWEGGGFEGEVMFVAVTNTRSYGGGFVVSPAARLDDGRINVCVVRRTGRARLLWQFRRIFRGTHGDLPEVTLACSPWVRLEGPAGPLPVALDGELPHSATPVDLRCEAGALRVLIPAAVEANEGAPCRN
jgi:diacylglycerol kinase (ATP)